MFKPSNEKGHEAHTSCQLIIDPGAIVQVTNLANPVSNAHQMTPICEKSHFNPLEQTPYFPKSTYGQ